MLLPEPVALFQGELHFDATSVRYLELVGEGLASVAGRPLGPNETVRLTPPCDLQIGPYRLELRWGADEDDHAAPAEDAPPPSFVEQLQSPAKTRAMGAVAVRRAATAAYLAAESRTPSRAPPPPVAARTPSDTPRVRSPACGEATVRVPTPPAAWPKAITGAAAQVPTVVVASSGPYPASGTRDLAQRFHTSRDTLAPHHAAARRGWDGFEAELVAQLATYPDAEERRDLLIFLDQNFPQCAAERSFRALAAEYGADLVTRPALAELLVVRFGQLFESFGLQVVIRSRRDIEVQVLRIATALDAFAHAFLGLRTSIESIDVESTRGRAASGPVVVMPLERLKTEREIVAYLLDHPRPGEVPSEDLRRAYASLMSRVLVAFHAMRRGVRKLHGVFAPTRIEFDLVAGLAIGRFRLRVPLWRDALAWRAFKQLHATLGEDGHDLLGAVFSGAPALEPGAASGARLKGSRS